MSAELPATATVEEILSKKSVIELRELARSFYVKGLSLIHISEPTRRS